MPKLVNSERQLLDSLLETLRELPEMHANLSEVVQSGDRSRRYDAQIDLRRGRKVTTLLINVKKSLYPRDIWQVLWRNQEFIGGTPQSVFLLAAESISPGAKDLLRESELDTLTAAVAYSSLPPTFMFSWTSLPQRACRNPFIPCFQTVVHKFCK